MDRTQSFHLCKYSIQKKSCRRRDLMGGQLPERHSTQQPGFKLCNLFDNFFRSCGLDEICEHGKHGFTLGNTNKTIFLSTLQQDHARQWSSFGAVPIFLPVPWGGVYDDFILACHCEVLAHTVRRYSRRGFFAALNRRRILRLQFVPIRMTCFCHCEASAFTGRGNPFLMVNTVRQHRRCGFFASL